ncbi:MAG TPA: lactonase family protein [Gemmataceae bacterium]|nr:lactonase family protein [Gemmataceae bacterium]
MTPQIKCLILAATALLAVTLGAAATAADAASGKFWVFVGTYTKANGSKGIYRCELDTASGKLSTPQLAAEARSPSFLAIHPSSKFLYAVGEYEQGSGGVSGFTLDPATGALKPINTKPSGGSGPCHLVVDKAGQTVLVANYNSGSAATLSIGADGSLNGPVSQIQHSGRGKVRSRQDGPHAHSVNLDAANRFAVVADLGLDKLMVYRFNPSAHTIAANDPPSMNLEPGAGPRHFAWHPDGKRAYVIDELDSTLTACDYDASRGVFTPRQTVSTLPSDFKGKNSTAEVVVHPSGKFVYGSNRGMDTIAGFTIDPAGMLRIDGHTPSGGRTPRNFNIDPTGSYLIAANQDSNNLVVFRIDQQSGKLTPTGQQVEVGQPVCVKFLAK